MTEIASEPSGLKNDGENGPMKGTDRHEAALSCRNDGRSSKERDVEIGKVEAPAIEIGLPLRSSRTILIDYSYAKNGVVAPMDIKRHGPLVLQMAGKGLEGCPRSSRQGFRRFSAVLTMA